MVLAQIFRLPLSMPARSAESFIVYELQKCSMDDRHLEAVCFTRLECHVFCGKSDCCLESVHKHLGLSVSHRTIFGIMYQLAL